MRNTAFLASLSASFMNCASSFKSSGTFAQIMASCGLSFISFQAANIGFTPFILSLFMSEFRMSIMWAEGSRAVTVFPFLARGTERVPQPEPTSKTVFIPRISGSITGRSFFEKSECSSPLLYHCALSLFQNLLPWFSRIGFFLLVRAHTPYRGREYPLEYAEYLLAHARYGHRLDLRIFQGPVYLLLHGNCAFLAWGSYTYGETDFRS